VQNLHEPSFFFTTKTGDEKELVLDFISPNFNMS
jgi:hypothetical protein